MLSRLSLYEYGRAQSPFLHSVGSLLPRMGGDSKGMVDSDISGPASSFPSPKTHVPFSPKLSQDSAPPPFFFLLSLVSV